MKPEDEPSPKDAYRPVMVFDWPWIFAALPPIAEPTTMACDAPGVVAKRAEEETRDPLITHVAIRFQGKVWSLPPPNRHHDVIRLIVRETGVKHVDARDDDQGFLIDGGDFCRRAPALRIAKECGQLKPGRSGVSGKLYSEDVW